MKQILVSFLFLLSFSAVFSQTPVPLWLLQQAPDSNMTIVSKTRNGRVGTAGWEYIQGISEGGQVYYIQLWGNDATAIKGNPNRPYRRIDTVLGLVGPGDLVWVGPGNFSDVRGGQNMWRHGVTYYLEEGCSISGSSIFIADVDNSVVKIYGAGKLGGGSVSVPFYSFVINAQNIDLEVYSHSFSSIMVNATKDSKIKAVSREASRIFFAPIDSIVRLSVSMENGYMEGLYSTLINLGSDNRVKNIDANISIGYIDDITGIVNTGQRGLMDMGVTGSQALQDVNVRIDVGYLRYDNADRGKTSVEFMLFTRPHLNFNFVFNCDMCLFSGQNLYLSEGQRLNTVKARYTGNYFFWNGARLLGSEFNSSGSSSVVEMDGFFLSRDSSLYRYLGQTQVSRISFKGTYVVQSNQPVFNIPASPTLINYWEFNEAKLKTNGPKAIETNGNGEFYGSIKGLVNDGVFTGRIALNPPISTDNYTHDFKSQFTPLTKVTKQYVDSLFSISGSGENFANANLFFNAERTHSAGVYKAILNGTNADEVMQINNTSGNGHGLRVTAAGSGFSLNASNSSTGGAVFGSASSGNGVRGSSLSGSGVYGEGATGVFGTGSIGVWGAGVSSGIVGWTQDGFSGSMIYQGSMFQSSVKPLMVISNQNSGNGQNGIGASLRFDAKAGATVAEMGHLGFRFTDVSDLASSFFIENRDSSGVQAERFELTGEGQLRVHGYTPGKFTGTGHAKVVVDDDGYFLADTTASPFISLTNGYQLFENLSSGRRIRLNTIDASEGAWSNTDTTVTLLPGKYLVQYNGYGEIDADSLNSHQVFVTLNGFTRVASICYNRVTEAPNQPVGTNGPKYRFQGHAVLSVASPSEFALQHTVGPTAGDVQLDRVTVTIQKL